MLVIRRRPGETLLIGDEIEVDVLEISGSYVKLGIRAPKAIPVARKEIRVVSQQNQAASRRIPQPRLQDFIQSLKNPRPKPISAL